MRVALIDGAGDGVREHVAAARTRGAELICLPQLSFAPYFPAGRDRAELERAERPPGRSWRDALAAAGSAWLCGSAYESEGEGVFYLTARLAPGDASADGGGYRQVRVERTVGRFEAQFWSPGHTGYAVVTTPAGPLAPLLGADLTDPAAWAAVVAAGAAAVVGGVSEPDDRWSITRRTIAGLAAAHRLPVAVANRAGEEHGLRYPGAGLVCDPHGATLDPGPDGLYDLELSR